MSIDAVDLIAFDVYGTLVRNDYAAWDETIAQLVREHSLSVKPHALGLSVEPRILHREWNARESQFRRQRTNMDDPERSPPFRTYFEAWRDAFEDTFEALGLSADPAAFSRRCVERMAEMPPFPDAAPALEALAPIAPLAVLSNADNPFLDVLARCGWRFDAVVSSESARAYKPDPRAFAALVRATGVAPERILYVGDSPYDDAHGAKLAGMRAVLIRREQTTMRTPPPDGEALLAPDAVVESLTELPALLAVALERSAR
ncbi:MAG: HAD-IA family hydrolase [Chloroflexota bacterium]|nr:HAD-IA family hydrolase [Chloroflexota bacterium]